MVASFSSVYTSASVNRNSNVADWTRIRQRDVLAFASHKSIAISVDLNPKKNKLKGLIQTKSTKPINVLKFIHNSHQQDNPVLAVGDQDGNVFLYSSKEKQRQKEKGNGDQKEDQNDEQDQLEWTLLLSLDKSKGQITAIAGLKPQTSSTSASQLASQSSSSSSSSSILDRRDILLTASSDGSFSSWQVNLDPQNPSFQLMQTVDLKGPLPLDMAITQLPLPSSQELDGKWQGEGQVQVQYVLALGLTDRRVRIWTGEYHDAKLRFTPKLMLEGHEDWIRSLDFCYTNPASLAAKTTTTTDQASTSPSSSALMLASGSQDNSIRLWRIRQVSLDSSSNTPSSSNPENRQGSDSKVKKKNENPNHEKDEFDLIASKLERDITSNQGGISNKAHLFYTNQSESESQKQGKSCWAITFDALLVGHDDKVTGVKWHPVVSSLSPSASASASASWQPAALLSSSSDNSLILWSPSSHSTSSTSSFQPTTRLRSYLPSFDSQSEESAGVWLPEIRFGEIGGTGTSSLGYYGGLFSPFNPDASENSIDPTSSLILAHGWGGATHLWSRSINARNPALKPTWNQVNAFTGHFMGVKSVCWERNGRWFLSASQDRTTRLHGIHRFHDDGSKNGKETISASSSSSAAPSWHEFSRPQTHGYDLSSVTFLDRDGLSFASASDEKVVRLFQAPKEFVNNMKNLSKRDVMISEDFSKMERNKKSGNFLLILNVPDLATFSNPGVFEDQFINATNRTENKLVIMVTSSLLVGLGEGKEECHLSFRQIEDFLKYCYSKTFGIAVKQDRLMLDINVLLLPTNSSSSSSLSSSSSSSVWESLKSNGFIPDEIEVASTLTDKESTLSNVIPKEVLQSIEIKITHSSPSSATIQFISKESTDGKTNETRLPFPRHDSIALGGTFDHIHVGHKILLSMAALIARKKIIVGVTGESMLSKKSNGHLLETLSQRLTSVESFLSFFTMTLSALEKQIVELADVCGPAGSEPDLQAMLLTEETASGGDMIASTRSERNLSPLERYTIGVIGKDGEAKVKGKDAKELAAGKIGSTAIREWLRKKIQNEENQVGEKLELNSLQVEGSVNVDNERALNASVPPLGLSNRAVYEEKSFDSRGTDAEASTSTSNSRTSTINSLPPHEDILHLQTLWPELDKLYGHGYELLSINSSPDSRLIATTCKAQSEKHAVIRIYDSMKRWEEIKVLPGHSLSITRVKFSPDGRFLLSASRDRSLRIWKVTRSKETQEIDFILIGAEKAHARIIWDLAWDNETDIIQDPERLELNENWSGLFATASRDKTVKIWQLTSSAALIHSDKEDGISDKSYALKSTLKLSDSVTSIAFGSRHTLAVGLESGDVLIYKPSPSFSSSSSSSDPTQAFSQWDCVLELRQHHTETVSQLSFRPREFKGLESESDRNDQNQNQNQNSSESESEKEREKKDQDGWQELMLASVGLDGAVRLIQIKS